MNVQTIVIIRDYLKDTLRIIGHDKSAGYEDGTLLKVIHEIDNELRKIDINIKESK